MRYQTRLLLLTGALHSGNDYLNLFISPVLPLIIAQFQLSYSQAGLISTTYLAMGAVFQPLVGYAGDSSGRRKLILLAGLAWSASMYIMAGLAPSFWVLLLFLGLAALGSATYHPQAVSMISEVVPPGLIGRALGVHLSLGGIGILVAPVLTAFVAGELGWQKAYMILAAPVLLMAIVAWPLMKESRVADQRRVRLSVIMSPQLMLLIAINALTMMCMLSVLQFLPTYYVEARGTQLVSAGLLMSIVLAPGIPAPLLAGWAADRFGKKAVLLWSLVATTLTLVAFLYTGGALSIVMSVLFGFSCFASAPLFHVYATDLVPDRGRGVALGMLFAIGQGIGALGPAATGMISAAIGLDKAFLIMSAMPLIGAGLSLFVARGVRKESA